MARHDKLDTALDDILGKRPKRNTAPGASTASKLGTRGRRGAKRLQQVARIAARTPEVMVKVTSGARGNRHVREHFNYITRNGKLAAETDQGEALEGKAAVQALASDWLRGDNGERRMNSRDTVNLVLSMPPGTDRNRLQDAARNFAARNFAADRQYLLVRHDDTEHPHCHLTLKAVGYDGRRLNPRKAQLQAWRESFADCLRERGVAAEASPRRARGQVRKGKRQAVLHANKRGGSSVAKTKVREAVKQPARSAASVQPWTNAIEHQQQQVRNGWRVAAEALRVVDTAEAKQLAGSMRQFVQSMPSPETERQALRARVRKHLEQQHRSATVRKERQAEPDQTQER